MKEQHADTKQNTRDVYQPNWMHQCQQHATVQYLKCVSFLNQNYTKYLFLSEPLVNQCQWESEQSCRHAVVF